MWSLATHPKRDTDENVQEQDAEVSILSSVEAKK